MSLNSNSEFEVDVKIKLILYGEYLIVQKLPKVNEQQ